MATRAADVEPFGNAQHERRVCVYVRPRIRILSTALTEPRRGGSSPPNLSVRRSVPRTCTLGRSRRLDRLLLSASSPTSKPAKPSPPRPTPRRLLSWHRDSLPGDHPRTGFVLGLEVGFSLRDPGLNAGDRVCGEGSALGGEVFLSADG